MASNEPKVEDNGFLKLVDPNPPGREVVPTEDLFIYVKLSARSKERCGTNGDETEVNFIATKLDSNANDGTSYATTDYTEIGGLSIDQNKEGTLEGFGIKSIDITYNASLVPQVNITFIDLRGASLFDVIDSDNRESPYSVFFKLPYPIFELTVKGYYGQPVTYCLHMLDWKSQFNGSDANFEITAKFVGFQSAFLTDIKLQHVLGVIDGTNEGLKRLSGTTITNFKGEKVTTPKLSDFLNNISKVDIDIASLQTNNKGFDELKKLNSIKSVLGSLRSYVGPPITMETKNVNDEKDFKKDREVLNTSIFSSPNFTIGRNILSIRDIIIIKSADKDYFNTFVREGNRLYSNYKKYVLDNNLKDYQLNNYILKIDENNEVDVNPIIECGDEPCTFNSFTENFYNSGSTIYQAVTETRVGSIIKTDFRPENITPNKPEDFLKLYESKRGFTGNTNVVIYDFSLMRDEIAKLERKVKKEIDSKKEELIEEINKEISKQLNFNPKIRDVFSIIINNVQAMIQAISDISDISQETKKKRYDQLVVTSRYITDSSPKSKILCPWPEVVKDNGDDSKPTQVWLGSVNSIDKSLFPEIKFVEDVIKGYTQTSKELKENRKLVAQVKQNNVIDNWLPFNILDYSDNPYAEFSGNSPWKDTKDITNGIPNSFYETTITRALTLFSYTNVNNDKFNSYSFLEGAIAVSNIKNKDYPQVISENFNSQQAIDYCLSNSGTSSNNKIIVESGNNYVLKTKKINGFDVSGEVTDNNNENLYLIVGPKLNPLTDNRNNLDTKVKTTYKDKLSSLQPKVSPQPKNKDITNGIFYLDSNYVYYHNISYLVWSEEVYGNSKFSKIEYDTSYSLKFNSIDDLGGTDNISVLRDKNSKIISLKESQLWSGNTNEKVRAFLMLNTLPFKRFEEILDKFVVNVKNEQKVSKVLNLPKVYVAWVGSILWRLNESTDPVKNVGEINIKSKDEYITKLGGVWKDSNFLPTSATTIDIKNTIPKKTQEHLIEFFDDWFKDDWKTFYSAVSAYKNENEDLPNNKRDEKGTRLLTNISNVTLMGVPTPNAFEERDFEIKIPKDTLTSYLNNFKIGFDKLLKEKEKEETSGSSGNGVENDSQLNTINDDKLKLAVYNYFKGLYDKWISGTDDGKIYNSCVGEKSDLIEYFKFIDRSWSDIGDKATINLNSVVSLATDTSYELNLYISKILRDSNFLFQIFPSYIDFKTDKGVKDMFKPFTTLEENNTGPAYVCIYAGGQSKSLAINDNRGLKDDGLYFNKGEVTKEFTKSEDKINQDSLVAFRVAFGSENQSFFNNVSLNQTEHKPTAEYYRQLSEMVDKRGGTQRVQKGNDLYDLFSVRSYKCSVDGIGNMNIQPLSYFQLDNVPFYRGAYLITSVEHSITPNHMTTSFSGLRQSRFSTPVEENTSTFLNINFEEVDEIAIKSQAQKFVNAQSDVNNNFQILNPTGGFDVTTRLSQTNLNQLLTEIGGSNISTQFLSNSLIKWLPKFGLKTNSEVCNFLAQCAFESGNFNYSVETWNKPKPNSDGVATNGIGAQLNYENNSKLGNTEKGDGLRFKGRGFIQVTGRSNYKNLQNDTTSDDSAGKAGDLFTNITTQYNTKDGYIGIDKLFNYRDQQGIERSVVASLIWWKNSGIGTLNKGTVAEAQLVSKKVNPGQGDETINKRTKFLEEIVDYFNLKTDYTG